MTLNSHKGKCKLLTCFGKFSNGVLFDSTSTYDSCYVDRFHPTWEKPNPLVTVTLLYSSYFLIFLICVLATVKQRINLLKASFMTAMNLGGYCMLVFLKDVLADTQCNNMKPNSVSGHFAFYLYHVLTLPYIWRHSHWPADGQPYSSSPITTDLISPALLWAIRSIYAIFLAVAAVTLHRTYTHGYHSLRQCLNGVLFAIVMHFGCVYLLKGLDDPSEEVVAEARRARPSLEPIVADVPLITFGIFNILSLYLAYLAHGSLPLAPWELLLDVLSWARILWGPLRSEHGVSEEMLAVLMSMGFEENICRRGLIATHNQDPDAALNWILENQGDPEHHYPVTAAFADQCAVRLHEVEDLYDRAFTQLGHVPTVDHKMVLVVRKDLNMSVGKVAAQCSHAAVSIYKRLLAGNPKLLSDWEREGQKKVVVSCDSESALNELERRAVSISVPCQTIRDAGRTEVATGSKTVLVVLGPDYLVDQVTGKLPLLH